MHKNFLEETIALKKNTWKPLLYWPHWQ